MSETSRPSPAYTATIVPFDLQHPTMRDLRLSRRQIRALTNLQVPIVIDGTSTLSPCAQGELAVQDAAREALGREVCAVLYRWHNGGELYLMRGTTFVQVASVDLAPAQTAAVAA